ncbi:MAG: RluA family pseudouridine synthase [candidate division Zixibacteria bacterium]|nr:RluA family pseudouridine synthase [Candidatus Tariuqbacter arcticus]
MIYTAGEMVLKVASNQGRIRIDAYLVSRLPHISRSRIKQLITDGLVTVDSEPVKPSRKISPGESITLHLQPKPQPSYEPENIPLDIIYEDRHLAVINKPAGMVVHPGHGNFTGTLMNALLGHNRSLMELGEDFRAGIVHRLDKDTTGLLVTAKDEYTLSELGRQFSSHTIERKYTALVWGHPKKRSGVIEGNLGRSNRDRRLFTVKAEGKPALTSYSIIEYFEVFSLLEIILGTGRTHQIRVHFSHIGHPVFGDPTYGGRNARFGGLTPSQRLICAEYLQIMKRQALHAKTLGFFHPVRKEFMRFDSELPEDMRELLEKLR